MKREELLGRSGAHMAPDQILTGLSAQDAARRAPGLPHTIVEILAHMAFWQNWFLQRCQGIHAPAPAHAAEGWPPASAADWEPVRDEFLAGLARAVELPDTGRIAPPIEYPTLGEYTVGDAIGHMALHNAHHLGQIVTVRQALGLWPPPGGSYTW
jgi:uncharacterized damage-inducible protein DinB